MKEAATRKRPCSFWRHHAAYSSTMSIMFVVGDSFYYYRILTLLLLLDLPQAAIVNLDGSMRTTNDAYLILPARLTIPHAHVVRPLR
jgi:hypothetical protein